MLLDPNSSALKGEIILSAKLLPFCSRMGEDCEVQSYLLKGQNLTGDIEVTAPPNWELSKESGHNWTKLLVLDPNFSGRVYLRLISAACGEFRGQVSHVSAGCKQVTLAVAGAIGEGSEKHPYPVASAVQLDRVREDMKSHYRQYCAIDMSKLCQDKNWIPIGTEPDPFRGSYDGKSCQITGIRVDNYSAAGTSAGLFGGLADASLKNILLQNAFLRAFNAAPLSSGYALNASIVNCHVRNCQVSGNSLCAGLVSQIEGGEIKGCSSITEARLFSCGYAGIFSIADGTRISNTWAVVETTAVSEEPLNGVWQADSFCGFGVVAQACEIKDCYARGRSRGSMMVTGFIQTFDQSIYYGWNNSVSRCYCAVKLDSFADPPYAFPPLGGFSVETYPGSTAVLSCYYDKNLAGTVETSEGEGLATAQAMRRESYKGWDFSSVWDIKEGCDYPVLRKNPPLTL